MAEDWAADVQRYSPNADHNAIAGIDLSLNFHPAAIRASAVFDMPFGAVGATGGNA